MKKKYKKTLIIIGSIFVFYLLVYTILSINGRYEPAAWGLRGVKWYSWAPYGFVKKEKYEWRKNMIIIFLPLWSIDRFYIHPSDDA